MYKTCLFCKKPLGSNQVIEYFPVGRRLAFDGEKGRLWVVCPRCLRWNLTPLEERWEAIEECERIYRDTRVRVSTENIGIARHGGGLDLVRIGKARRREFAAWRYGDLFRRRFVSFKGGVVPLFLRAYRRVTRARGGVVRPARRCGRCGGGWRRGFLLRTVAGFGSADNDDAPGAGARCRRFRVRRSALDESERSGASQVDAKCPVRRRRRSAGRGRNLGIQS